MTGRPAVVTAMVCASLLLGCSPTKPPATVAKPKQPMSLEEAMHLIDRRAEWTAHPEINIPRHPAEKFLKDMTIVIDPGHGGEDGGATSTKPAGYKAGRAGEKEAFMNLRVSLLLQRLLKDAGVNVIMTREGDDTISLSERAEIANKAKADLFVSIHHNAGGGPTSNYGSVWYHGTVDDNEPDVDVARYLALELGRAMRTQVAKTSPIFSSQLMYDSGFGVLRACDMPAVLCECSFYTDPVEEQRLRDAGYNLREAYAIYVGLCEWAYCGRPTQSTPKVTSAGGELRVSTTLDEGLPRWWGSDRSRIVRSTIQLTLDGQVLPIKFDELTREVSARLPALAAGGEHVLAVHHANMFKNHNWPQRYQLRAAGGGAMSVELLPAVRPRTQPATRATTRP